MSMTGFGEARAQTPHGTIAIEVRSVNNRFLKVAVRGTEPYPMLESEFEKVVRRHIKRGTLQIHIRVEREASTSSYKLNGALFQDYVSQIRELQQATQLSDQAVHAMLPGVLALPGVAPESVPSSHSTEHEWPLVEQTLSDALARLNARRAEEGRQMATELQYLHRHIVDQLELIRQHLPAVVADYRNRLLERIRQAIAEAGVTLEEHQLIREVALFADRTDVSEEVTRLTSHLEQFHDIIHKEAETPGRRLEFVVQEMGRETNTTGSKAGDVTISRYVVEIKATLEKIRELVQNIE